MAINKIKKALGVAAQALCLMASVQAARGACLVLDGGATIEVKTAPKAKGALVVFQDANGRLASMRGTEVDRAATDDANARGVCGRPVEVNAWDSSRPVPIQAPVEPAFRAPTAAAILSGMPASSGPPKGLRIDCRTVECGKVPERAAKPEPAATEAVAPNPLPGEDAEPATAADRPRRKEEKAKKPPQD